MTIPDAPAGLVGWILAAAASTIAGLWYALKTAMEARIDEQKSEVVEVKAQAVDVRAALQRCQDEHIEASKQMGAMSERLAGIEGRMKGYDECRKDMQGVSDLAAAAVNDIQANKELTSSMLAKLGHFIDRKQPS